MYVYTFMFEKSIFIVRFKKPNMHLHVPTLQLQWKIEGIIHVLICRRSSIGFNQPVNIELVHYPQGVKPCKSIATPRIYAMLRVQSSGKALSF